MAQATAESAPQPAAGTRTPYRIRVHNIEACNCSHGCNCQFGGNPDRGNCEAVIAGEVIDGRYGDVDMAGTRYAIAFMYPGAIHQGNGRLALFIDEKAGKSQADAIVAILSGQAGGMPWEALAGTVGSLDGPNREPIEMTIDGTKSSFRIPGKIEMRQTPIRDAVSGAEKEIQIVYPKGGFMWDTGNITSTAELQVDCGPIKFRHPGGYSCYATPTYTNQR